MCPGTDHPATSWTGRRDRLLHSSLQSQLLKAPIRLCRARPGRLFVIVHHCQIAWDSGVKLGKIGDINWKRSSKQILILRVQFWLNLGFVGSISSHFRNLRIFYANFGISLGSYSWLVVELRCREVRVSLAIFGNFYAFPTLIFYQPNFSDFFELQDTYLLSNTSCLADFDVINFSTVFISMQFLYQIVVSIFSTKIETPYAKFYYHPFVSTFLRKNPENAYIIFWYQLYIHKP